MNSDLKSYPVRCTPIRLSEIEPVVLVDTRELHGMRGFDFTLLLAVEERFKIEKGPAPRSNYLKSAWAILAALDAPFDVPITITSTPALKS